MVCLQVNADAAAATLAGGTGARAGAAVPVVGLQVDTDAAAIRRSCRADTLSGRTDKPGTTGFAAPAAVGRIGAGADAGPIADYLARGTDALPTGATGAAGADSTAFATV